MNDYKLYPCAQCGFEYDESRLAGRRYRTGHSLGRHSRRLELPGLRRGEERLRHGGDRTAVKRRAGGASALTRRGAVRASRQVSAPVASASNGPSAAVVSHSDRTTSRPANATSASVRAVKEASRVLLRSSVLDSMRELLTERDWSEVTLTRSGQACRCESSDALQRVRFEARACRGIRASPCRRIRRCGGRGHGRRTTDVQSRHLTAGFGSFFASSATDPLVDLSAHR